MKMSVLKTTLLCVSGLGLFGFNAPALAGGCGVGVNPALCKVGVNVNPGTGPVFDNMNVNVHQPMGYLRSIDYQRAPNVSITRVHGMMDTAGLTDFPSSFTGGCHPSSTAYCRQDMGTPVNVEFTAPQASAMPAYSFVAPQPAPIMMAPSAPRTVAIGGGYDPSKFVPRQYGEFTFTPGTVYAPTSYINRNPADAARVLSENGYGSTISAGQYSSGNINLSAPLMTSQMSVAAPAMPNLMGANMLAGGPQMGGVPSGAQYLGSVVTGQTTTGGAPSENAISGVDGSGGYWEKVSGLTMFGDTVATSVVCRRQAPTQTKQVVSPVYGIPQPVPTPVPQYIDVPYKVRVGHNMPQGCRPVGAPFVPPAPVVAPRPLPMPGVLPYGRVMGGNFGPQFGRGIGLAPTIGHMHAARAAHGQQGWTY
jgi:hypothetical protein